MKDKAQIIKEIQEIAFLDKDPKIALFNHIKKTQQLFSDFQKQISDMEDDFQEMIREEKDDMKSEIQSIKDMVLPIATAKQGEKGEKGDPGKDGKDADEEMLLQRLIEKIPPPVKGDPGKDGMNGRDGLDGIDGKDADEEEIIKKVLQEIPKPKDGRIPKHEWKGYALRFENPDGTWGDWKYLKGEQGERGGRIYGTGNSNQNFNESLRVDLSDQCDGATYEFTLPAYKSGTVTLYSTQFPIIYRPGVDFVETNSTTITLQSGEVGAPESGQTLIALYAKQ